MLRKLKTEKFKINKGVVPLESNPSFYSKNSIFVFFVVIVIIIFLWLIKLWNDDVMSLKRQNELLLEAEIDQCRRDYERNRCDTKIRIPMAEEYCREKEKCLKLRGNSKTLEYNLHAVLLGEVINSFIESLSWKSIFFMSFVLIGYSLLWLYIPKRSKSSLTKT